MIENRADELEIFKTKINLAEYAEAHGYTVDKKDSSKNCLVMRSGSDKIIVTRGKDGHDVFFSVVDDSDNGSIIDFAQKRQGLNLGQVRKELRPWAGLRGQRTESVSRRKPEGQRIERPAAIERDRAALLTKFYSLRPYAGDYLERERKLSRETIAAFAPILRTDAAGNTAFIHKDASGEVTGWEVKNKNFTGYAAGGEKSLASHMPTGGKIKRVVITESMIDAMSHHQKIGQSGTLYVSIGGSMSPTQNKQLQEIVAAAPAVVIATDNDKQGHEYASIVQQWRPSAVRETPSYGKDWNDEIKHDQLLNKGMSI